MNPELVDKDYESLMNEAIVQSILEQDDYRYHGGPHNSPSFPLCLDENSDEKHLKEAMKLSTLEQRKKSGYLDLSHLKRKKKP